jgi:hypothetical protein
MVLLFLGILLVASLRAIPAAGAQATATTSTSETLNIPPPTGCTTQGDVAPASLAGSLAAPGIKPTTTDVFSLSYPDKTVRYSAYAFLASLALIGIMILVGIGLVIAHFVQRRTPLAPGEKRSHATRNAYLAVFVILILVCGASFYVIYPYLADKNSSPPQGQLQNFLTPATPIPLLPLGVETNKAQTYPNGQVTFLGGNFSTTTGTAVEVVIIPDSEANDWVDELRNGTLNGQSGCPTMGDLTVLYDSGPTTSGAFSVQIPPVSHDTNYDLVFANPSGSNSTTVIANVYYGLPG